MHEAPYFSLLLDGSYSESALDFAVRYEPYTVVFHDALTEHRDAIGAGGCRMFFVELLEPWTETIAEMEKPAHLFEMDGSAPAWLILRLHREFAAAEAASVLTVESLLYELIEYLSHSVVEADREPEWLPRADALLRTNFASHIEVRSLADQIGVNPSHLCRTFRRFRRRTIGEHVVGLRVQYVCRQLTGTTASMSKIADVAGFTDQSHMTRVFKRITGVTPAAYRHEATQT